MSYCQQCARPDAHPLHKAYHDTEYGFPARADAVLFERLVLEINQAGLSWLTILKKRPAFAAAYEGFDVDRVAAYGETERARLLGDAGIVRNRRKIDAAVENARRLQAIRESHGSFAGWLDAGHPLPLADWTRLFKRTFVFTGGEIVREFLGSLGYLPDWHDEGCPTSETIRRLDPPWMRG
jgi:DNA-3-methyladenine glycosylase I